MSAAKQDRGRFSSKRKMEAVLRLLGGEDLDLLSRELGVAAGTLSGWRSGFPRRPNGAVRNVGGSAPADHIVDETGDAHLPDAGTH